MASIIIGDWNKLSKTNQTIVVRAIIEKKIEAGSPCESFRILEIQQKNFLWNEMEVLYKQFYVAHNYLVSMSIEKSCRKFDQLQWSLSFVPYA